MNGWFRLLALFCFLWSCIAHAAQDTADGDAARVDVYSASASYGEDHAYSVQLGGGWAVGDVTRVRVDTAVSVSPQELADLTLYRGQLGGDWAFKPIGFTLAYEYWGDFDHIDTHAALGSLYFHSDVTRIAAQFERRRITLNFDVPVGARALINDSQDITSDGIGVSARQFFGNVSLRAQFMDYRYDVPIGEISTRADLTRLTALQRVELLRLLNEIVLRVRNLNASSLTMANSLLDRSVGAGIDIAMGDHLLAIDATRERAATDGLELDTLTVGWTMPLGQAGDIEYRLGVSHADELGSTAFAGISFWFYR